MSKTTTVGELLRTDDQQFDPMNLDTSDIQELSEAMPRDGNIDIANAEVLATKYLRGADMCGELIAIAAAYVGKTRGSKLKAYNFAFLVKSESNPRIKTDKMRVAFAELDQDYLDAYDNYNKAIAFSKWVESKYSSFIKMHYLCKNIVKMGYEHEQAASWNGKAQEEKNSW